MAIKMKRNRAERMARRERTFRQRVAATELHRYLSSSRGNRKFSPQEPWSERKARLKALRAARG